MLVSSAYSSVELVMDAQGEEFRAETDGELRGDPASHPEHLCSGGQKVQLSWSDCVEDRTVIQEKRRFYCYPGTEAST